MKIIKRFGLILIVLIILISCLPLSAFAVDPMSSSMIANAFAQAIASYGASQGAAMTFDVSSTDQIGSGVHELWSAYCESKSDSDDWSYWANLFLTTNPFSPISVGETAAVVGVTISEDIKPVLDDFWSWLLSGPAEMVKVDDQYFEWSNAQIGDNGTSIAVQSLGSFSKQPIPLWSSPLTFGYIQYSNTVYPLYCGYRDNSNLGSIPVYFFLVHSSGSTYYPYAVTTNFQYVSSYDVAYRRPVGYEAPRNQTMNFANTYNDLIYTNSASFVSDPSGYSNFVLLSTVPVYESLSDGLTAVSDAISGSFDTIGVKAYGDNTTASFPDVDDPNYDAVHPPIPLNIPWDETIYGDGTGTLTDAQTQSIVSDLVGALEHDGTVDLVETTNPPVTPDFQDVILPLIPISLPNFNFSLSGIWHYVRDWVNSLGAWLSLLFTTWSYLPYAITVPVYASLVIVIVLGLYRRFFM